MPLTNSVLSWLHIGDLHITEATERNYQDMRRIMALADDLPAGSLDFALLPGDNADDGAPEQFRLIRDAIATLRLKLYILPGDHDFKPRNLRDIHEVLGARKLPYSTVLHDQRCLFLDVVSAGTGGPDFRLGKDQLDWVEGELDAAASSGQGAVIFMHTYPADLREGAERILPLLARPHVLCVDMGHTHYNELANDGGTIFMATRSTGQIEEGAPGFSIAAVDGRTVSWRFKTVDEGWPFVLVTAPADSRLVTAADQIVHGPFRVRAKVVGDTPIEAVEMRLDDGAWTTMSPAPGASALWEATCDHPGDRLVVRARDARGRTDQDEVELAREGWTAPQRAADGSDRDRLGAWAAKGLFDGQLGPNRNGRKW